MNDELKSVDTNPVIGSCKDLNAQNLVNMSSDLCDSICADDESGALEESVVALLKEKKYTLTAAESCTGGLFMSSIINVSGASDVIKQGYVTYSEEAKMSLLGVNKEALDEFGVVSEEVAREMAIGAAKLAHANVSIGITGFAGPSGGTIETPVGTVCIGLFINETVYSKRYVFTGNRKKVREQSVISALEFIRCKINIL